ncbi:MAG: TatD family hydrolase [Legionellaceae bacterium]|nr:TatD family hydrolase [Legionellaceae bacterium]
MLIDSHCHLQSLDLSLFDARLENALNNAYQAGVQRFLSVCCLPADFDTLCAIADEHASVYISVGVHPTHVYETHWDAKTLVERALMHPACIAMGETGLDYFHHRTEDDHLAQQKLFRAHIEAACTAQKPLIIHTREAAADTIRILQEENASRIGGVMHCFTESWEVAKQALDQNFFISFSGIVSFKNATALQEVAKKVPLDRILIETDAPYLAPVPHRGKPNQPAWVKHVAEAMSEIRGESLESITEATSANFYRCFHAGIR